jgi:hypothetical protein
MCLFLQEALSMLRSGDIAGGFMLMFLASVYLIFGSSNRKQIALPPHLHISVSEQLELNLCGFTLKWIYIVMKIYERSTRT